MKKLNLFCLSLVMLGWVCVAHAELKMGYVNAARLLEEAPQAEQSMNRLKKEFSPREEKIVTSQKTITDREDQLRLNSAVMTEEARRKMERDVVADKRELRRIQDEFRDDLNFRRNEEIGKLQALVKQIIEKVGKDEKYDLILFDGIAYANERIDLTDKILKRLKADMDQPTGSERSPK